ncbi:heterokaryon incompatibility protein-domain-containing protein [Apodospora peruviana]|uniref:Heterokaryon incompatibility protein-domain-containing protein n=1 Tax=Apodospora peruviana TaxID=516989 RepID=A0AAE0IJ83_9PEZI|nr:heterokaryon incompatibility protein-domain-containing protein [Apodospora peruviana]
MAPVEFHSHSCEHCQRLIIEATDWTSNDAATPKTQDPRDMSWNKIVFGSFTLQDLNKAAAERCALAQWMLDGESISRRRMLGFHVTGNEEDMGEDFDQATYAMVIQAYDDDPSFRHASLVSAVQDRDDGVEIDDYILVADTNPAFKVGMGYTQDVLCIEYFGLMDPQSKVIPYRTLRGLQLFTHPCNPAARDLSTRPIENQPTTCIPEISAWLQNCRAHHTKCSDVTRSSGHTKTKPKRLIKIDFDGEHRCLRLQATDQLREPLPDFAALSYCWGGDQKVKLDTSTMEQFTTAIEFAALPATLQDAVKVCEQIGLYYLWIDALCILQDCDGEKATEIAKMPYIYGGAAFTIVASRSRSVWEGFLHDRVKSPEAVPAFLLPWRCDTADERMGSVTLIDLDIATEPIDERGWTLQERMLSSRIVEFGSRQTRWTCQEGISKTNLADGLADGWRKEAEKNRSRFDALSWNVLDRDPQSSWAVAVEQFTRRKLTQSTDRSLAISGVAERFSQKLTSYEYVAGLWTSLLHSGLIWCVVPRERLPRPTAYQGPSWSWLAVNSPVHFQHPEENELAPDHSSAEVVSVTTELVNVNAPFGAIQPGSGVLRVKGRLIMASYRRASSLHDPGTDVSRLTTDHVLKLPGSGGSGSRPRSYRASVADLYLDCEEDAIESSQSDMRIDVWALEIRGGRNGPMWLSNGLVLRQVQAHDGLPMVCQDGVHVFERIGEFEYETGVEECQGDDECDADWEARAEREFNWFTTVEPRVIEIL